MYFPTHLYVDLKRTKCSVARFLSTAEGKFGSGSELADAAAKALNVDEKTLLAAVEEYKHCNCTHAGGAASHAKPDSQPGSGEISDFAENVLLHVILHELGHGLVREFDLPVLGNEETLADVFATHFVVTRLPDRALPVLNARITSLMIEAGEVPRMEWTVKGEHNSDARRAFQIAAVAIAYDPDKYSPLAKLVQMDPSDIRKAVDYGSELHRSWRRILTPLWMPRNLRSTEARVDVQEASVFGSSLAKRDLVNVIDDIVRSFDWHSQVTVSFAAGDGGAAWSRSRRTVTVHDGYIERFNRQATSASAYQQTR